MELKTVLKKQMQKKDVNLAQIARATKVPLTTLSNWMNGQKPRDVVQVKAVADYFQITIDYLLFAKESAANPHNIESHLEELKIGAYEVVLKPLKVNKQ